MYRQAVQVSAGNTSGSVYPSSPSISGSQNIARGSITTKAVACFILPPNVPIQQFLNYSHNRAGDKFCERNLNVRSSQEKVKSVLQKESSEE